MPRWTTSADPADEPELPHARRRKNPWHHRETAESNRGPFPGIRTRTGLQPAARDLTARARARGVDRETDLAAPHRDRRVGGSDRRGTDPDGYQAAAAAGRVRGESVHPGAG